MTLNEIMEASGKGRDAVGSRLRALKLKGLLTTGEELREGIDGRMHRTVVYFIKSVS